MGPKLCTVETFFAFFFCKAYLWPVMASAASSNFILCSHLEVYKKGRISQTEIGLLHIVTLFAWPWFPSENFGKEVGEALMVVGCGVMVMGSSVALTGRRQKVLEARDRKR